MSKELCEKQIRTIAVNIAATMSSQSKTIKEKQETSLTQRWERSNCDEKIYITSLKTNVLFYKVSIRNKEVLLTKWMQSRLIPDTQTRNKELEILSNKCRDYIQRGIKSQGSTFSEADKKIFMSYENIEQLQIKSNLEKEYKTLNLYNEVLSIFINDLSSCSLEEFKSLDAKEILSLIKGNLVKATNFIKKHIENDEDNKSSKEDKKDNFEKLNPLEVKFLQILRQAKEEDLIENITGVYQKSCNIEEIEYNNGFGFSKETIKDFVCAVILLDMVDENEVVLLKGGLRLLIGGEFGTLDYSDFIKYIATNRLNLSENVYEKAMKMIESRHSLVLENELCKRGEVESKNIDIEEYIYILENTDSSKKYRKDVIEKSDIQVEVSNTDEINEVIVNTDDEDTEHEKGNSSKKGKKVAIICAVICTVVGFGVGGLYIGGAFEKNKPEIEEAYTPPEEEVEEVVNTDTDIEEYFIVDSDSRYLTEEELLEYTQDELGFIRNEIFARYGYVFKNDKYVNYFSEKSWYVEDPYFEGNESDFNVYEIENIKLIKSLESTEKNVASPSEYTSSSQYKDYFYIKEGDKDEYYAVYTEAFNSKSNAESYKNTLAEKKIKAEIVEEEGIYKVKAGETWQLKEAEEICAELGAMNVNTYILGYSVYYDVELKEMRDLAESGYYDEFYSRYISLKREVENRPKFGRYKNLLNELYEEYKQYL